MSNHAPSKPKVALVTGASSGIGRETVTRLIESGYRVAGCARRHERLAELESRHGDDFVGVTVNLQEHAQIEGMFARVREALGPIGVLINNAGVGYDTSVSDGDPSHWKEMIDVNFYALALCCRFALDDMRGSGSGHIVNISSMSGHRVTPGGGVYSATKYAVRAFTEGLRQELSAKNSKVRVTAISPGFVETEFYSSYYHTMEKREIDQMFQEMKALTSTDVVDALMYAISAPAHVGVNDILLRPLEQQS